MTAPTPTITLDELKARAAALGVTVKEEHWESVHQTVERGLGAIAGVDPAELKSLEPSVTFRHPTRH